MLGSVQKKIFIFHSILNEEEYKKMFPWFKFVNQYRTRSSYGDPAAKRAHGAGLKWRENYRAQRATDSPSGTHGQVSESSEGATTESCLLLDRLLLKSISKGPFDQWTRTWGSMKSPNVNSNSNYRNIIGKVSTIFVFSFATLHDLEFAENVVINVVGNKF